MTYKEALDYINHHEHSKRRLSLDRAAYLMSHLGDPQNRLKFIHVAGSNGKGSTCAMLASILQKAGYKTGLYISPYLQQFGERMQINGELIPEERVTEITERVKTYGDAMKEEIGEIPTHFEIATAIAMEYFAEEQCDIVVLEVGMGGAYDATNVILPPEAAVITNIGLEHTEYLGDTLEKIATVKAGIIKSGGAAVLYDGAEEVSEVVKQACRERGVPLIQADFSQIELIASDLGGQELKYRGEQYHIGLLGVHQRYNSAVVLDTVRMLRFRGWDISDEAVQSGLAEAVWPARLEVLSRDPLFILDGGHNPQCALALAESLDALLPGQKFTFLVGVLADKDYEQIFDTLLPYASEAVCITPDSERSLPAEELARMIESKGVKSYAVPAIHDAMLYAQEIAKVGVIGFGSLYSAGEIRTEWQKMNK